MPHPIRLADVRVLSDVEALALAARNEVVGAAERSIRARGVFNLALAGGSTPKRLYEILADPAVEPGDGIPWKHVHIFFGDERFVPADHPDSNFKMSSTALLDHVPLAAGAVYRIPTEIHDPAACAARYEAEIREALVPESKGSPRLDLILLGMGADGHTASLFPGVPVETETERLVMANWVEKLASFRISFTLPFINNARAVMFLVAGANKADALARVLDPTPTEDPLPAARVRPTAGKLLWLVDTEAASRLARSVVSR